MWLPGLVAAAASSWAVAAAMPEVKEGKQEAGSLSVRASFLTKISELTVDAAVCQQI